MRTSPSTTAQRRQTRIMLNRAANTALLLTLVVICSILLSKPTPSSVPSATEIAKAVNGPEKFQRPSSMEYVAKTNSCVVGGTVTSAEWHVGPKVVAVGDGDSKAVDYTVFGFKSDAGRVFNVSSNDALFMDPGENLGLELRCDPTTMMTDPSFGLSTIVYGGK